MSIMLLGKPVKYYFSAPKLISGASLNFNLDRILYNHMYDAYTNQIANIKNKYCA